MDDPFEHWPRTEAGELEEPALLEITADFEAYAGLTLSKLEAYGIPVVSRYGQRGEVGRMLGGFSTAGARIYVPKSLLEDARELMRPVEDNEEYEEEQT